MHSHRAIRTPRVALPQWQAPSVKRLESPPLPPLESLPLYAFESAGYQHGRSRWRRVRHFDRRAPGCAVRGWLLDEGSLTARLIEASDDRFSVRVLRQCWARPLPGERAVLGMSLHEVALVREVLLECAGEPWVFARSILPARSLSGRLRHLRRFGARSLGALLFAQRGLRREPFEVALLHEQGQALWARRSVFHLHGKALLVQEVFLPACKLGPL